MQAFDTAVGGGVVVGEGVGGALAGGEKGRGGAVVIMRGAIGARTVIEREVALQALLVKELDVATGNGVASGGAGDGDRVAVHVADVDGGGPHVNAGETRFDEAVDGRAALPNRDAPSPADREGVARGGRERGGLRVAIRGRAGDVGGEGDGERGAVGIGDGDGQASAATVATVILGCCGSLRGDEGFAGGGRRRRRRKRRRRRRRRRSRRGCGRH